jgi:hypothetical protein
MSEEKIAAVQSEEVLFGEFGDRLEKDVKVMLDGDEGLLMISSWPLVNMRADFLS